METFDPGYKEYLRVAKLADSLTGEEAQLFDQLMETDQEFRAAFSELTQTLTPAYIQQLQKYKQPEHWPPAEEIAPPAAIISRSGWFRMAAAASVLLAMGLLIPALINRSHKKQTPEMAGIELTLSNGQKIDLSGAQGAITTDAVTLQNTGKQLTYNMSAPATTGMNTLNIAPGKDYQVTLADGTQVWLNSTSTLEFPFSFNGATREVTITGEAYLKVAKNKDQPFIVHLPRSSVLVTGTAFNVNTFQAGSEKVALVEGAVILEAGNDKMALKPGSEGVYANSKGLYEQPFNQRNTLSWMEGLHYFEKSNLEEIIQVISRWYNVKVVIDNSRNNDKRFVGILNKKKPLDSFLNTLEYVADIQSYIDKENVLHFR
ncbi:MAG: FecR domain-containing protein [Chitinophagaceae bacterium]|nr:FecR domain-containing protein [Chitinophagaceae bacterium]